MYPPPPPPPTRLPPLPLPPKYITCPFPRLFPLFFFSLHTYLVEATVIKKTVCHVSSPALHSAEARSIKLPSGTSLAKFLFLTDTLIWWRKNLCFSSDPTCLVASVWRRTLVMYMNLCWNGICKVPSMDLFIRRYSRYMVYVVHCLV